VLPTDVVDWGMSSRKCVQSAVQNVQEHMTALHWYQKLQKKESGPFVDGFKPKLDLSPELDPITANFYQSQIGVLRWCVELVCIDILTEVSMLSTHISLPHEGHLEAGPRGKSFVSAGFREPTDTILGKEDSAAADHMPLIGRTW
jgi:hypothetical protein